MNPVESFTLCPSSAFAAYDDNKENHGTAVLIAGTIRPDRPRPIIYPEVGLGFRASPFEPLLPDRNLPKSGTISPLDEEEYKAWLQSRQDGKPMTPQSTTTLGEQYKLLQDNDDKSWKVRYLVSEMSRTETRMNMIRMMEEKRQLRIKLLELEANLHDERAKNKTARADDQETPSELPLEEKEEPVKSDTGEKDDTADETLAPPTIESSDDGQEDKKASNQPVDPAEEIDGSKNDTTPGKKTSPPQDNNETVLSDRSNEQDSATEVSTTIVTTLDTADPSVEMAEKVDSSDKQHFLQEETDEMQMPVARMTRSRRKSQDEKKLAKDDAPLPTNSKDQADQEGDGTTATTGEDESIKKEKPDQVDESSADVSFESQASTNPKKIGKRKRKMKSNLYASFQEPALKKQTRRRTRASK